MKIIQLQVKDGYTQNVLGILNGIKDVMLEKIEVQNDPNLEHDPYFYERKAQLDETIEAVGDGTMKMYDFNESMDKLIGELKK
ncbi:MAG: hypothetical protein U9P71_07465 [Campylobacterota bacterium]|nr:hypothetical protein [Campylobacterota bacterium]